jgi:hypothetical protein
VTRRVLGGRTLAVVAASTRHACKVCDSLGCVRIVALSGMRGAGVASCPHCAPEPGQDPIHIRVYPTRTDTPRDHEDDIA